MLLLLLSKNMVVALMAEDAGTVSDEENGVDDEEDGGCVALNVAKDATTAVGAVAKDAETIAATCPRAPGSTPRSSLSPKYDAVAPALTDTTLTPSIYR